jgi:polyphosphate kinase 2 (PPK2 family)
MRMCWSSRCTPSCSPPRSCPAASGEAFWEARYEDINAFERHLVRNGTVVLKFFLNVSKKEQKRRFLERLETPEKHWKFSASDLEERGFWGQYTVAYEDALSATSTEWAPWYIVPADHKWATRAIIADNLTTAILGLDLHYPEVTEVQHQALV